MTIESPPPESHGPRLAASNIAWLPEDDGAVAELLRHEGFGGIEIAPTKRWIAPLQAPASDVAAYRAWWGDHGLPIVAMQALVFGRPELQLFGSGSSRRALFEHLNGIIGLGERLGARALVFGSPKNRLREPMPLEGALDIATDFFRRIGTVAADHGTVLCLEPNPPEYGCDFITTTAEALALCRRIDSPGVGVQGDLGAMTMVGDSVAAEVQAAGALLSHFHVSEPQLVETGTGGVDHEAAARALATQPYAGWISIEMRAPMSTEQMAPADRIDRVRRAARLVKGVYGGGGPTDAASGTP